MYESRPIATGRRRHVVAREAQPAYRAAAPSLGAPPDGLAGALEGLAAALEALADVDLDAETDESVREASVAAQTLVNRLHGQQLRVLERLDGRDAYRADGAVTAASWLRTRTRQDHPVVARQVEAARRLRHLPRLRAGLESGRVTLAHTLEVTRAAVPRRMEAIAKCETALVDLACHTPPRDVRRAVRTIRDQVDPDGTEAPPLDERGRDERRELDLHRSIDGLWQGRFTFDLPDGEALATVLEAYEAPDPPGTPADRRRSAGQRRADALAAAIRSLLDRGQTPAVQGNKPHLLIMADLHTLLGQDHAATFTPRLRHSGRIDPDLARRLAATEDVKATVLLTMGPWRVTNVGRTHRTLPPRLRPALEAIHGTCRGPDCDRPATWTEAHHERSWADGGDTDLNATVPACPPHHDFVTHHGWHVRFDPDTGICTWTSPDGRTIQTHPPPP